MISATNCIFKNNRIVTILIVWCCTFAAGRSVALEQLSDTEMNTVSGQMGSFLMNPANTLEPGNIFESATRLGGISIMHSPIQIFHTEDSLRLTPSTGYLQLNGLRLLIQITSTWHNAYLNAPIHFDSAQINEPDTIFTDYYNGGADYQDYSISNPLNGSTFSRINASESIITINGSTTGWVFNDKNLGYLSVNNLQISKIQAELLAVDGTVNFSIHSAIDIDQIKYTHDTETAIDPQNSITINGLLLAEKFQVGGSDDILPSYLTTVSPGNEINSSNWTSYGTMKLGTADKTPLLSFEDDPNLVQGAPTASVNPYAYSSIRIIGDAAPYMRHKYTIRTGNVSDMSTIYEIDPDGYIGDGSVEYPFLANPRLNKSYLEAKIAFEGSMRVRGIEGHVPLDTTASSWGNANMGIVAVDGVRSLSVVEAPGYGYGNDWNLPYDESKHP